MPARTNTERIEEIGKQVIVLTRDVDHVSADLQKLTILLQTELSQAKAIIQQHDWRIVVLEQRLGQVEAFTPSQIPIQTQRINHLEKLVEEGRTRRWQVWIAFLGAILSAVIAAIVAIVRK